jgi:transposase InsO family protein
MARKGMFGDTGPKPAVFMQAKDQGCDDCIKGKFTRHSHPSSTSGPVEPLFRMHTDVHFISDQSVTGDIGFVSFLEDNTDFAVTTLIKRKSEVAIAITDAVAFFETQYAHRGYLIKRIRSDNGGEYKSHHVAEFCARKGIVQEFSSRETPQQNGKAERFGRGAKDRVRTMCIASKVHVKYWPYALKYSTLLRNCTPTVNQKDTPYFAFYGVQPALSLLEDFGTPAWVQIPAARRTSSLQPRAVKGIFLGLTLPLGSQSSYALVDGKVLVSTDVVCVYDSDSMVSPCHSGNMQGNSVDADMTASPSSPSSSQAQSPPYQLRSLRFGLTQPARNGTAERLINQLSATLPPTVVTVSEPPPSSPADPLGLTVFDEPVTPVSSHDSMPPLMYSPDVSETSSPALSDLSSPGLGMDAELPVISEETTSEPLTNPIFGEHDGLEETSGVNEPPDQPQTTMNHRGTRTRNQPVRYGYAAHVVPSVSILTDNVSKISAAHPELHFAMTASTGILPDPKTIAEALSSHRPDATLWRIAIDNEFQSLVDKGVYAEAILPPGARALGTRPLLVTKRDGTKKCRIVAQGFSQRPGVDFDDTFAPVCRYATLRNFLAICAAQELDIRQLDVKVAFLNATLDEVVYARPPAGYESTIPRSVWRLFKALYGLRQAPRAWYSELRSKLRELGFKVSDADPSLFVLHSSDGTVMALIYVDDCLIAAKSIAQIQPILASIAKFWEIKDMGTPTDFLGISIVRPVPSSIAIHQSEYINKLADLYDVRSLPPRSLPLDPKINFVKEMGPLMQHPERYRALIGALLHLANCTRPDISFAIGVLSRYSQAPCDQHWDAALGLLQYCLFTHDLALHYGAQASGETLQASIYHDSDFASSQDCRRSTSGYVALLNNGAVTWASKKRETVALSTMEAEYQSASLCGREVMWLRKLWPQLGFQLTGPTLVYGDNKACLALCASQQTTPMSKHIHIIHMWVSEKVEDKELVFKYITSSNNVADILTKALFKPAFEELRTKMGLRRLELEMEMET